MVSIIPSQDPENPRRNPPNISLDRTGDAGRVWRDCCMLRMVLGQCGALPRPISSRALGGSPLPLALEVDCIIGLLISLPIKRRAGERG